MRCLRTGGTAFALILAADGCSSAPAPQEGSPAAATCPKILDGYVTGHTTVAFVKGCLGPPVHEERNIGGGHVDLYEFDKTTVVAFSFDSSGKLLRLRGYQPGSDNSIFRIPKSGWGVLIDLPDIRKKSEHGDIDAGYLFEGDADNLSVNVLVERPHGSGTGSDDAYRYYWAQAERDPSIDQKTIQVSSNARYTRVEYFLLRDSAGKSSRSEHVHYYGAHEGRWIDVHVSVSNPTDIDQAAVVGLDAKLDFVSVEN